MSGSQHKNKKNGPCSPLQTAGRSALPGRGERGERERVHPLFSLCVRGGRFFLVCGECVFARRGRSRACVFFLSHFSISPPPPPPPPSLLFAVSNLSKKHTKQKSCDRYDYSCKNTKHQTITPLRAAPPPLPAFFGRPRLRNGGGSPPSPPPLCATHAAAAAATASSSSASAARADAGALGARRGTRPAARADTGRMVGVEVEGAACMTGAAANEGGGNGDEAGAAARLRGRRAAGATAARASTAAAATPALAPPPLNDTPDDSSARSDASWRLAAATSACNRATSSAPAAATAADRAARRVAVARPAATPRARAMWGTSLGPGEWGVEGGSVERAEAGAAVRQAFAFLPPPALTYDDRRDACQQQQLGVAQAQHHGSGMCGQRIWGTNKKRVLAALAPGSHALKARG